MLRRTGAPEGEQLAALSDAIKAFSASVGPTDPQTAAFGRLAHVALAAQAIEIAVTAGMQAIGGLQARGQGDTPEPGGIYAALAMAAAARRSPAAPGAADRAYHRSRRRRSPYRASAGGFEAVGRSGGAAALRFEPGVEVPLDAAELAVLRAALAEALAGGGGAPEPRRNDPCPCASRQKYKRCCGR